MIPPAILTGPRKKSNKSKLSFSHSNTLRLCCISSVCISNIAPSVPHNVVKEKDDGDNEGRCFPFAATVCASSPLCDTAASQNKKFIYIIITANIRTNRMTIREQAGETRHVVFQSNLCVASLYPFLFIRISAVSKYKSISIIGAR